MKTDDWQLLQTVFHKVLQTRESERIDFIHIQNNLTPKLKEQLFELLEADQISTQSSELVKNDISSLLNETQLPNIENYDFLERIASGGMGSVYKAWDKRLSRHVAIKLLHPHRSQQEKAKQRFLREARASARIRHDNICPVFEISQTDQQALYIVSAFCEGLSLARKIHQNDFNLDQIILILEQLLSALNTAHAQGIIHRDLKPENIIVDQHLRIQLVDFGIAKIHDEFQTGTGEILGTPSYMSPEQFRGEATDQASDIWSFGIIMYELLEGRTPYHGKTAPEIIYSMLHEPIQFNQPQHEVFPDLYNIIRQCLQTNKNLRPRSIESLIAMLLQARQQLTEQKALPKKPVYKNQSLGNSTTNNSLVTQRNIVNLCLKIDQESIEDIFLPKLENSCRKYRGIFNPEIIKNQEYVYVNAFFGYPTADEMSIKNAILCGEEWSAILTKYDRNFNLLAGFEKIVEHDQTISHLMPILTKDSSSTFDYLQHINKSGFWIMNKLAQGLPDNLGTIEDRLDLFSENTQVVCHRITDIKTENIKNYSNTLSPFTGRNSQLSILLESWEQAIEGDQQRILISGEAGIGKSRLIYEFIHRAQSHPEIRLIELDCSPYEQSGTYYPVLRFLRTQILLNIGTTNTNINKFHIQEFLTQIIQPEQNDHLLLCNLMDVKLTEADSTSLPTGDLLNRQYQSLLIRLLTAKPKGTTSLLVIEDLHWMDAATGVIVEKLLQPPGIQHSLIILSCRPEYKPAWLSNIVTSNLFLSRLRKTQCIDMLKGLLQDDQSMTSTNDNLFNELAERSGGNPLFIEEMVKTLGKDRGFNTYSKPLIPDTIQDTLVSRLEKLGIAQELAQMASVIGRDFDIDLLRLCQNENDSEFEQQLHTLIQADIINTTHEGKHYRFKHALIRDAAYQMLLPESQQKLHQLIAENLESHFPEVTNSQPELLAQHWEAVLNFSRAVEYWTQAAQRNLQLSSISECLLQCDHAFNLAAKIPEQSLRDSLLLSIYMTQGPALMSSHGYADEAVKNAYGCALELSGKMQDPNILFPIIFGLWTFYCVRAEHSRSLELAEQLIEISQQTDNQNHKCEAHMVRGISKYYMGIFIEAKSDFSHSLDFYAPKSATQHIMQFGQDPYVVTHSYQSWNECLLGNIEEAAQHSSLALQHAQVLNNPFTHVYALCFAGWFSLNINQLETAHQLLDESIQICETHEIAVFTGLSKSLMALLLFAENKAAQGEILMKEASKIYLSTGAALFIPSFLIAQAEVVLGSGDLIQADQLLDQSLAVMQNSQENWCLAPALALKAIINTHQNKTQDAADYLSQTSNTLTEQNAAGWAMMLKQKGLPL